MKSTKKAQGAIEYLLIIGTAILIVSIVILATTGALGTGKTTTTAAQGSFDNSLSGLRGMLGQGPGDGSTQTTAGASCKAIKTNYSSSTDGTYWIDPDGGSTSNAFQAYCEMTMVGGGWTRLISLTDHGGATNNLLDKWIYFNEIRAVKRTDHTLFQSASFTTARNATSNFYAQADLPANTVVMLMDNIGGTPIGACGVYSNSNGNLPLPCNWNTATSMFGAGWDPTDSGCGIASNLAVGRNTNNNAISLPRFDVDLYVR